MPRRLYAASIPVNSRSDFGSWNCCTTNARTCSFDLTSTFGGVLNFSPTAVSIRGTASATCLPYGSAYSGRLSEHASDADNLRHAVAPCRSLNLVGGVAVGVKLELFLVMPE